jgi:hypothetical protein
MLTTMALMAALCLTAGQGGELELTNIRPTYGLMGPARADNRLLPGDVFSVSYDIENIKVDKTGKVLYSMGLEVIDGKGKTQYKVEPRDLEEVNTLGGHRSPGFVYVQVGENLLPGEYTLRVTVTDRAAKKTKSFDRKFEVVEPSFGIVRLNLSGDAQGLVPVPPVGVTGEKMWVHFTLVGFDRGKEKKDPDISLEIQIMDENGTPTLDQPIPGEVKELPKDYKFVPIDYPLNLNRAGKFTVRLKATDKLSKKSAEMSFPITVAETK